MLPNNIKVTEITLSGKAEEDTDASRFRDSGAEEIPSAPETGAVTFAVQPNITEAGSANYTEFGDMRQAASILLYMGSPSRTFTIDALFVSRTEDEARKTMESVRLLRAWRMPEVTSDGQIQAKSPSRLELSGLNGQFNKIKVRMTDLNIPFPEETDYIVIPNNGGAVPIVWNISMTLRESRTINELAEFDINMFRQGTLGGW